MSSASSLMARCALAGGVAMAAALPAAQAAEPFTILYTGSGEVVTRGIVCGPNCRQATWNGRADDWAGNSSPIPGHWEVFRFEELDLSTFTFTGYTTWTDTGPGGHNLEATFSGGVQVQLDASHVRVYNDFVITGGTGMFQGATGTGEDRVYTNFVAGQYVESGILNITPVPEPATLLMFAAGLAGLASRRLRRG
jgi:hypothetical protein